MRRRVRSALGAIGRWLQRIYDRLLTWSLEIAFGLGFLVWFIVSSRLTGGKL